MMGNVSLIDQRDPEQVAILEAMGSEVACGSNGVVEKLGGNPECFCN
jgi:hypothetical protein